MLGCPTSGIVRSLIEGLYQDVSDLYKDEEQTIIFVKVLIGFSLNSWHHTKNEVFHYGFGHVYGRNP